jgi:hypothetical protein
MTLLYGRILVLARVMFCLFGTFFTYSYCSCGCETRFLFFDHDDSPHSTAKEHRIHPLNHDDMGARKFRGSPHHAQHVDGGLQSPGASSRLSAP